MTNEVIRQNWRNEKELEEVHREWHQRMDAEKAAASAERGQRWHRAQVTNRGDIIGIRQTTDGAVEYLCHNEALCEPYYTAVGMPSAPPTPPDAPAGELIERCIDAVFKCSESETGVYLSTHESSRANWRKWVTAAVNVVLADRGLVTLDAVEKAMREHWFSGTGEVHLNALIAAVRKRLSEQEPVEQEGGAK